MPIKRHYELITIKGVRALLKSNQEFQCRYDLVEMSNGKPSYQCIYLVAGKEKILIRDRTSERGVEPRIFNFWPGLFRHHHEFGDSSNITVEKNYLITTGELRGCNDVPDPASGTRTNNK